MAVLGEAFAALLAEIEDVGPRGNPGSWRCPPRRCRSSPHSSSSTATGSSHRESLHPRRRSKQPTTWQHSR